VNTFPNASLSQLIIPLILLLGNLLLSAAAWAVIRLRLSHFHDDWQALLPGRPRIHRLLEQPDRALLAARMGTALAILALAVGWLPLLSNTLMHAGLDAVAGGPTLAYALAVLLLLSLHLVVGEVLPKSIALDEPAKTLAATGFVLALWMMMIGPVIRGCTWLGHAPWRHHRKDEVPSIVDMELESQIEALPETAPEVSAVVQTILLNAVKMRDLVVSDILLPRNQVKWFDLHDGVDINLQIARETGHTRFPLCVGDLDHCIGLIHIKDLFRHGSEVRRADLRRLRRDILRVNSEEPLESALTKLLSHNMHMALVIDEFRGTEGVITLERILEELVGDIRDEFDLEEEQMMRDDEQGDKLIAGLTPLHELEELFDLEIDNDEVSTLGGLITSELGRIPEVGETLDAAGLHIEVTQVDDTRVIEARVRPMVAGESREASAS
jgi:CBS domain containing-hemolysin-like protein